MPQPFELFGPAKMPVCLPSGIDNYAAYVFRFAPAERYVVLAKGALNGADVLTRITSLCAFGHVFRSHRCDCHEQLAMAMQAMSREGTGLIILGYDEECRGMGIEKHVEMYRLIDSGMDTVEASRALGFPADARSYENAAAIIKHFGIAGVRLLTNNPKRIETLRGFGLKAERIPLHAQGISDVTRKQLRAKAEKWGYLDDREE